jgi:hypothetical protein
MKKANFIFWASKKNKATQTAEATEINLFRRRRVQCAKIFSREIQISE